MPNNIYLYYILSCIIPKRSHHERGAPIIPTNPASPPLCATNIWRTTGESHIKIRNIVMSCNLSVVE